MLRQHGRVHGGKQFIHRRKLRAFVSATGFTLDFRFEEEDDDEDVSPSLSSEEDKS
jgi:hypothetical protein